MNSISWKNYYFATWLRAAATISILLCHYVAQSQYAILNMSAQFFNIGVEIFIILSGFLFGLRKGGTDGAGAWYIKRLKRIFVPYELFVVLLFIVHAVCARNLWDADWIWLVFGLQGSVVGVLGAEQTWFITPLLMCYLITPLLDKYIDEKRSAKQITILCGVMILLPLIWAMISDPAYGTLLSLISYYTLAFVVGRYFDKLRLTKPFALIAFCVMCLTFGIRLLGRHFYDATILYDRIICGYTQTAAAFCIFYIFAVLFETLKPPKPVAYFSEISFEIYLVHYMFCVGPVSVFGLTPYWVVNCVLVTVISILLAMSIHTLSKNIIKAGIIIC